MSDTPKFRSGGRGHLCVRVPPQYAYGDEKKGKIPANSPLVFFMELVELGDIQKADGFLEEISKG